MKYVRQKEILDLIQEHAVGSQDALQSLLKQRGFPVTQATISRDIRELNLIKRADNTGVYRYVISEVPPPQTDLFSGNIMKVDCAANTVVIKCKSGTAQAVCTILDDMHRTEIVGTLAGDDTIFVLIRTAELARRFANALSKKIQNR